MSDPENILEILAFVRIVPFSPRFAEIWTMCLLASWNIQPLAGGLVGQPLDLTAATASSSSSSLSPPSSSSSFWSPPLPPSLLCSLLTVAATVPERPRPAPEDKRRQQMEKPPKLLISLANLGTASFPGLSPSPSFSFNHLSTLTLFIQNCFQKAKASLAKKMKVV